MPVGDSVLLRGLCPDVVNEILPLLRPAQFAPGRVIYAEGQQSDSLYLLVNGRVKLVQRAPDGRCGVVAIVGPNDLFGETSVFDTAPRPSTAIAMTSTLAMTIDRASLNWWIDRSPEAADQLLRLLARRVRRSCRVVTDLLRGDARARIAQCLIDLAQQFGVRCDGVIRLDHGLTQDEMAQLVGTSRETVCKTLADFSRRDWIRLDRAEVLIVNSTALVDCARMASPAHAWTVPAPAVAGL
jgi:CRP/FNR family transcriptional regulator, cyclic AMP receptor protein